MNVKEFLANPPKEIVKYPDPILDKNVYNSFINFLDLQPVSDIMFSLLSPYPEGVGLAANQVGLEAPIFVIRLKNKKYTIVYPRFENLSEEMVEFEEGCLSRPGFKKVIKRHKKILLSYINEKSKKIKQTYTGLFAVVCQHEMDHLFGINIWS